MDRKHDINGMASGPEGVDDAVGVPAGEQKSTPTEQIPELMAGQLSEQKRYWFVAIVNNRSEKTAAGKLTAAGIENYLPLQEEIHLWKNGKRAKVQRVMIPTVIFVRVTETERRQLVKLPYIFRFMTNKAGVSKNSINHPVARVSNDEIERLRFMLGVSNAQVTFTPRIAKGETVEVVRGAFKGLTGIVQRDTDGRTSRLYVNIDFLGSASVEINAADVRVMTANSEQRTANSEQ